MLDTKDLYAGDWLASFDPNTFPDAPATAAPPTRPDFHRTAVVVKIDGRYFYGFGKQKQVLTAWGICGAKLFCHGSPELDAVTRKLDIKRKAFEIVKVGEV